MADVPPKGPVVSRPPKDGLTLGQRFRVYLFAGVLVTAPISITFYLAWLFVTFIDAQVRGMVPPRFHPETYLPFTIPGVGLILIMVVLAVIGWLTAGFLGRMIVKLQDRLLAGMPVVRNVYGAVKQILESVLAQQSSAFREVVLIEYPRRGMWVIGFITGRTEGEVQNLTEDEVINIFLPTTPNPTSGFLLFVPRRDMIKLDMSIEEGIKMVVSGGIVTPPDRRTADARDAPQIASRLDGVAEEIERRAELAGKGDRIGDTVLKPPDRPARSGTDS